MSAGIDYGMGRTNMDVETGFRYGVISQGSVAQAWADSSEPDYGTPSCPKCGADAISYADSHEELEQYKRGCADFACEECKLTFDSADCFSDEPNGWSYDGDGYQLTDCLDSDIFVLKSPYFTRAMFCSPCVPGAGNIDSPSEDGVETYCLGHGWFEGGKAPYPVYSVATRELVNP